MKKNYYLFAQTNEGSDRLLDGMGFNDCQSGGRVCNRLLLQGIVFMGFQRRKRVINSLFSLMFALCMLSSCQQPAFGDLGESSQGENDGEVAIVHVKMRGAPPILSSRASDSFYPLSVFAFSEDGSLLDSRTIGSASESSSMEGAADNLSLRLPVNKLSHIVAVTADGDIYKMSEKPSYSDVVSLYTPQLPDKVPSFLSSLVKGYCSKTPLQMGHADITPTTSEATLYMQLYYMMASLRISLSGLPPSCQYSYVTIATPAEAISFSGNYVGSQFSCIPLIYDSNSQKWLSDEVYVFPTTSAHTNFTITYHENIDAQSNMNAPQVHLAPYGSEDLPQVHLARLESCSSCVMLNAPVGEGMSVEQGVERNAVVTFLSSLKAGTPYILDGILDDGKVNASGTVSPAEWGEEVNVNFTFSPSQPSTVEPENQETQPPGTTTDSIAEFYVKEIPTPLSVWNNHIVASVIQVESGAKVGKCSESDVKATKTANGAQAARGGSETAFLLLVSLSDYQKIPSANNKTTPEKASEIARSYSEYDLTFWHIPTEDEARLLREAFLSGIENAGSEGGSTMSSLNTVITSVGGDEIMLVDEKGANIRYLCSDALRTYSFKPGGSYNSIKDAGATVSNYHLRLVSTVKVIVK